MNALYQPKTMIDGQFSEASNVQSKVEQDIAFLQHRIALMRKQATPNTMVIDIYESMLKSRLAVLSWLRDGNTDEDIR